LILDGLERVRKLLTTLLVAEVQTLEERHQELKILLLGRDLPRPHSNGQMESFKGAPLTH